MEGNKKRKICTSPPEVSPLESSHPDDYSDDDSDHYSEDYPEVSALICQIAKQKAAEIFRRSTMKHEDDPNEDVVGVKMIEIPNGRVGALIGKGGETVKHIEHQSGTQIQVTTRDINDPNSTSRTVKLTGTPRQIILAEGFINHILCGLSVTADMVMKVPNNKVSLVIGKGGETIKNIQARTGARIQVIPLHLPPGDTSTERTLQINGTDDQIEAAKQFVNGVISENSLRNSTMGGYSQQGYQAQPRTSWPQGGAAMQQLGYCYVQPGAYPGEKPQYNTGQAPYPGYPPQNTTGGCGAGWDQTSAPQNQQTSQGAVYNYYNQQPTAQQAPGGPGSAPTENASYGYTQYVAGQQPVPNLTLPSQGATWYAMPSSSQSAYGSQPSTGYGSGYGTLQAQKPPTNQPPYGQPQQFLSAQGRYPQSASAYTSVS